MILALPAYESRGLTIINDQCQSLPTCPVCGDITNLDQIVIERTEGAGGGSWIAFVLRCINSAGPNRVRRNPGQLCSFAVPMTLQPRGAEGLAHVTTPSHLVDRPADDNPMTRAWLPWALGRVDNIATLDDPDLVRATDAAATVARALVHTLSAWHTVAPKIAPQLAPSNDGGIDIVWAEQGFNLEIGIEPDGRITGWLRDNPDEAEVSWGDDEDA